MRAHQVSRLSNAEVERELAERVSQGWNDTAVVLALIAEVDERRLYVPAGYPSMHAYCVEKLRFSEDAAYRRIRAGRLCRQFPGLFEVVAQGRLHLAALCVLAPHMTSENAQELIAASIHRRKSEIEEFVARSFSRPEPRTILRPITANQLVPGRVEACEPGPEMELQAPDPVEQPAPGPVELVPGRVDSSSECYELNVTISKATREKLRYAQDLLSHCIRSGDVAEVLDRGLDELIAKLEKQKFGASSKPRAGHRTAKSKRCIPADVRHAVWARDQGQCTFVGDGGHRCGSRRFLEFDHVEPVARGGEATIAGVRLRCRPHNQYEAERTFGAGFMHEKRSRARSATETPARIAESPEQRAIRRRTQDVFMGLRHLGIGPVEARHAAESSDIRPEATLEEHMRAALRFVAPRARRIGVSTAAST